MNALSSPPATPIWADSAVNMALARLADAAASRRAQTIAGAIHRNTVEQKLVSAFAGAWLAATGSNRTFTGVTGHSDEDYFAIIPAHLLKADSQASLVELGDALRERFPRTAIRVDRPCVRVPFDDGAETVEITPATHMGYTLLGYTQFLIPDGAGGWAPSAPESHNAYVHNIDVAFGGDVRRLIVLAKIWKYERNVAIRSFFIEITCALHAYSLYAHGERRIDLAADLRAWLGIQKLCALEPITDPRFRLDGLMIDPCRTPLSRLEALGRIDTALGRADNAMGAEYRGDGAGALTSWWGAIGARLTGAR